MILKASQRGGASQLAAHLLKVEENEHVEIHEVSGFLSNELAGALRGIQAISQGTRCKQYMFSLSLNPPQDESVSVDVFEKALGDIERKMGLEGQPRVVIFHEKEGRRHAHCVWSRIKTDELKAINLPYFKMKLQEVSKQLYLENGWNMPPGLIDRKERHPLNFTRPQWQQAIRAKEDPKTLKALFQKCWAASDSRKAFAQALKEYGFTLARGDRRGIVAVDFRGEVFSLSRWTGLKNKELKARLGEPHTFLSVEEAKGKVSNHMTNVLRGHIREAGEQMQARLQPLLLRKQELKDIHREERQILQGFQEERWKRETIARAERLPKGLKSIWYKVTGQYQKIRQQNEREADFCRIRDRNGKQALIDRQLEERQELQKEILMLRKKNQLNLLKLRQEIGVDYLSLYMPDKGPCIPKSNKHEMSLVFALDGAI
ncbi:MAG: relaxase/mobilization nuclease domain-containing protein [Nitrospinales bacterium]